MGSRGTVQWQRVWKEKGRSQSSGRPGSGPWPCREPTGAAVVCGANLDGASSPPPPSLYNDVRHPAIKRVPRGRRGRVSRAEGRASPPERAARPSWCPVCGAELVPRRHLMALRRHEPQRTCALSDVVPQVRAGEQHPGTDCQQGFRLPERAPGRPWCCAPSPTQRAGLLAGRARPPRVVVQEPACGGAGAGVVWFSCPWDGMGQGAEMRCLPSPGGQPC